MSGISQWLFDWFAQKGRQVPSGRDPLNVNYFDAGMLSSLEVIEFVTDIEQRFGVSFTERDFQDRRFATVAGLSEMIGELQARNTKEAQ